MDQDVRIDKVETPGPSRLRVVWRGKRTADVVELAGWIATGGDILAPLRDPGAFAKATVADHGAAVAWDDDGDLAIDAFHLKKLANEQRPFDSKDLNAWQKRLNLSNQESAELVGVGLSTWNDYKAGRKVPAAIGMLLRVMERDPLLLQAHYRPRVAGRPRKKQGAA